MQAETDILIVGGGPAGLLAASILGARHRVKLVERGRLGWTSKYWVTTARRLTRHGLMNHAIASNPELIVGTYLGGLARGKGDLVVVDERSLLSDLRTRAEAVGVQASGQEVLLSLTWERTTLVAQTTSSSIRTRCLVDASGGNSPITATFRLNRLDGFFSVYGRHLRNIQVSNRSIVLAFVSQLGDPPPVLEFIPTSDTSGVCALFIYSKTLKTPDSLRGMFYQHCKQNPFFQITSDTRYSPAKLGAIPIGRRRSRELPGVFQIGEAAMVQPPLLGTAFNEILEFAHLECGHVSDCLDSTKGLPQFKLAYPTAKRFQDFLQLMLVRYLLSRNVEAFDFLVKQIGKLPEETMFNLCSNELRLRDLLPGLRALLAMRSKSPGLRSESGS